MEPKDLVEYGTRTRVRSTSSSPGGSTTIATTHASSDKVVQLSVDGDHVHPNSYTARTDRFFGLKGSCQRITTQLNGTYVSLKYDGYIASNTASYPVPIWDEGLYNACLAKLNSKVRGDLDLAVTLAQWGQTARMLRINDRLTTFAKNPRWKNLPRKSPSMYLEFTYGWAPLAQDLWAAGGELLNALMPAAIQAFKTTVASTTSGIQTPLFDIPDQNRQRADLRYHIQENACKMEILLDLDGFDPARWTTFNPASVVWESVPYSFVVDWVYDLGSYLRDVETRLLYGAAFRGGYITRSYRSVAEFYFDYNRQFPYQGAMVTEACKASSRLIQTYHNRQRLTSYPMPKMPRLKADLSAHRLFNLGALIAQRVLKLPPRTFRR